MRIRKETEVIRPSKETALWVTSGSRAGSSGSKLFHGRERHGEWLRVLTRKKKGVNINKKANKSHCGTKN